MSEGGEGEVTLSLAMHVLQASSGRSLRSLFPSAASPATPPAAPARSRFPTKSFCPWCSAHALPVRLEKEQEQRFPCVEGSDPKTLQWEGAEVAVEAWEVF